MLISHSVSVKPVSPGSDAGTDGWREWEMDIVAKAPFHVAVPEPAHPENS